MKRRIVGSACALAAITTALAITPGRALADGTATADGVTATLVSNAPFNQTVTISAPGTRTYSDTLPCLNGPCSTSLRITRLNPGPRPDVILSTYQQGGGDSNVFYDFSWNAPLGTWVPSSAGYPLLTSGTPTLQPLGGGYSGFVSHQPLLGLTDPESGVGVLEIQRPVVTAPNPNAGVFADQTARFPAVVTADAAHWRAAYTTAPATDNAGPLASWAADESIVGRGARAKAYIESQNGSIEYEGMPVSAATVISRLAADGYSL